jgi:hypothetical protein
MGAKRRCCPTSGHQDPDPANPLTRASIGRLRAALLTSASLIALASFGAIDAAQAACVPSLQAISALTPGPVRSNGGAITVTSSGSVAGNPDGVDAVTCSLSALMNGGAINGKSGAASAAGGLGVLNSETITTLANSGMVSCGADGSGSKAGGVGGAAISNSGTTTTPTNSGAINGGIGGGGAGFSREGGAGGAAVSNSHMIASLQTMARVAEETGVAASRAASAALVCSTQPRLLSDRSPIRPGTRSWAARAALGPWLEPATLACRTQARSPR